MKKRLEWEAFELTVGAGSALLHPKFCKNLLNIEAKMWHCKPRLLLKGGPGNGAQLQDLHQNPWAWLRERMSVPNTREGS